MVRGGGRPSRTGAGGNLPGTQGDVSQYWTPKGTAGSGQTWGVTLARAQRGSPPEAHAGWKAGRGTEHWRSSQVTCAKQTAAPVRPETRGAHAGEPALLGVLKEIQGHTTVLTGGRAHGRCLHEPTLMPHTAERGPQGLRASPLCSTWEREPLQDAITTINAGAAGQRGHGRWGRRGRGPGPAHGQPPHLRRGPSRS